MPFNKVQLLVVYLLSDVLNLYFWIAPSVTEKKTGAKQEKTFILPIFFLQEAHTLLLESYRSKCFWQKNLP